MVLGANMLYHSILSFVKMMCYIDFFLVDVSQGGGRGAVRKKRLNDVVRKNIDVCVAPYETLVILNLICVKQIALLLSFLIPGCAFFW